MDIMKAQSELVNKMAHELDQIGFSKAEGVLNKKEVQAYLGHAKKIREIEEDKIKSGSRDSDVDFGLYKFSGSHFYNVTRGYRCFDELIGHPLALAVLEELFGTAAILSQTELRNPATKKIDSYAFIWHRDGRMLTEDPLWVVCFWVLNDIELDCGPTEVAIKTHKKSLSGGKKVVQTDEDKEIVKLTAKAGDLIFMNSNTLHRATKKLSQNDRWLLIPTYSPWYVKPSMDYTKIFKKSEFDNLNELQKQVYGFTSTVPHDERKRVYTKKHWKEVIHEFTFIKE